MAIPMKKVQKKSKSDHSVFKKQVNSKSNLNKQNSFAQDILNLHHTIGNQAVQRLFESGFIQGKLTVGEPNDKYEQEADYVADQVMRMPDPKLQRQSENEEEETLQAKTIGGQITPLAQRQIEEEEEELLQAKSEGKTPQVTPNLESKINTLQGGGQPLPKETRNFFEPRFGANFSSVRIHTGNRSQQLARSINAQAFTHGSDIYFGAGKYNPSNTKGRHLMAHELTHTIQQKSNTASDIHRKKGVKETIEERSKQIQSELEKDGIHLDFKSIEKEVKAAKRINERTEATEKQWPSFEIGLQRDFFDVMDIHFRNASVGARRAIETIFKGINEQAELETLKWQFYLSPVRLIPGVGGVGIGGYIGKQIDTIIQVTIGMEKKWTIKKLKSELTHEIEDKLINKFDPNDKEYKAIMTNTLHDAKLQWLSVLSLYKNKYKMDDPFYAKMLRAYLLAKYPADSANKWRDTFINTYSVKFYHLFKKNKLL